MTHTARTITRDSDAWPTLAPPWAVCAEVSESGTLTFERAWTMPSLYRDSEPLVVIRVEQEYQRIGPADYVAHPVRVAAARDALWADWGARDVARSLREIADALDPDCIVMPGPAPVAEQEGEDG